MTIVDRLLYAKKECAQRKQDMKDNRQRNLKVGYYHEIHKIIEDARKKLGQSLIFAIKKKDSIKHYSTQNNKRCSYF